jgi:diguanylate cyclase (GGDEF)-like protein/PAS domain S-box-containing protein
LLLAGALALVIIAFEIWQALHLAHVQRVAAAERLAAGLAAEVALMLHREDARVARLRDAVRHALGGATDAPDPTARLAAAETRLREHLPDLVALTPIPGPAHGRPTTALVAAGGRPMLAHLLMPNGTGLQARRHCGPLCGMPETPDAVVHLVHASRAWRLPLPDGGAPDPPTAPRGTPPATARIAHPGADGWLVTVYHAPSFAAVPALLAALLLAMLTAVGGWRLWFWSQRRERALLRDQQRLTANQRKLQAVLDSSTDGIVMLDGSGCIELLNPAAEVMFGQLEADALGEPVSLLLPALAPAEQATDADGVRPGVYDAEARRGGTDSFPVRVAERRLVLDDGPRRLLLVQDLTEQQRQAAQMAFLEQRDVITGQLNRTEFERRMSRLLAEAVGSEAPHVLCYIDIDQFKVINDTVGHAAGDALIGQLAKIIDVKFQSAAIIGRLGGDEFGALFADRTEADVLAICEDLMQTVRNFLFTWRERSYDVAVSIGVTAFLPEHDSPEAELAKADVACHMAKREGRDRVHVYRDSDVSLIRHHGEMHLVSAITRALSGGRFRLYAQPIIPLAPVGDPSHGGRIHYEILLRMLDEHGQPVAPDSFIPAAERYILMPAIDRWVIHQLLSTQHERLRQWHREHPRHFLFAVNLSGTSVSDDAFLSFLKRQFELHDVPPASICFEVTETAAMRDFGQARSFIDSLAALGCSFALDDFGSGLSSYGYLRELPVKYLKIDGSFVRDMHKDPVNYALVASINQVAHVLGLKTIAEWAESETVINQLRALSVDFVQGFAIGEPLPVVDTEPSVAADMSRIAVGEPNDA